MHIIWFLKPQIINTDKLKKLVSRFYFILNYKCSKQDKYINPKSVELLYTVCDAGPTLTQHRVNVFLLAYCCFNPY